MTSSKLLLLLFESWPKFCHTISPSVFVQSAWNLGYPNRLIWLFSVIQPIVCEYCVVKGWRNPFDLTLAIWPDWKRQDLENRASEAKKEWNFYYGTIKSPIVTRLPRPRWNSIDRDCIIKFENEISRKRCVWGRTGVKFGLGGLNFHL